KLHHTIALHHDIDIALYHYYGRIQPSRYPHSGPIVGNWFRNNRVHACVLTGGLFFSKPGASFGRSTLLVVLTFW
ncbi:hypothetical protein BDZ91DRAFT_722872, partial [Kalaharituber pfeilii]